MSVKTSTSAWFVLLVAFVMAAAVALLIGYWSTPH
jgi:hypothetical protein